MKNKIRIKILIITLMLVLISSPAAYCNASGTVRMKIDNSTPWTNITVSDSYDECLSLNSTSSTLGTSALEGHLMTDYDWSAMAVLAVSQYGKANSNNPGSTNNNKSGVYDIDGKWKQTTGLLNTSTSTSTSFVSGLYDASGNPKKYVNKIDPTTGENQNGRICISFLQNGGTRSWLSANKYISTQTTYPVSAKLGLFGVAIGHGIDAGGKFMSGMGSETATFRPAIWN